MQTEIRLRRRFLRRLLLAVQHAQQTKARADWEAALKAAQAVDGVAPSPQSKFYIGVSSFQIGVSIMDDVQSLAKTAATKKDDKVAAPVRRPKRLKTSSRRLRSRDAGWRFRRSKTVAGGQILGALAQYGEYISAR